MTTTLTGQFAGHTILVTGGASGIGEAVAHGLFVESANLVLFDRNLAAAEKVAASLDPSGTKVAACGGDITKAADVQDAVALAESRFGRLDGAVNSAGIGQEPALVVDMEESAWRRVIDVHLTGTFLCLKYEIAAIRRGGRGGAVVNLSSALGLIGSPGGAAYVAAKHALVGLTKSAALEYAAEGIRVNAVAPGLIQTPLTSGAFDAEGEQAMMANHPIGRFGEAREVADLIIFLLSGRASFITGSTHAVDGAWTAH